MTTLYEKVGETEPGKYSQIIDNLRYNHSSKIGEEYDKKLILIRDYLEKLAFAEIDNKIKTEWRWVSEFNEKKKNVL